MRSQKDHSLWLDWFSAASVGPPWLNYGCRDPGRQPPPGSFNFRLSMQKGAVRGMATRLVTARLAQHVAASSYRLDIILTPRRV
jgi:hypothetical protein